MYVSYRLIVGDDVKNILVSIMPGHLSFPLLCLCPKSLITHHIVYYISKSAVWMYNEIYYTLNGWLKVSNNASWKVVYSRRSLIIMSFLRVTKHSPHQPTRILNFGGVKKMYQPRQRVIYVWIFQPAVWTRCRCPVKGSSRKHHLPPCVF